MHHDQNPRLLRDLSATASSITGVFFAQAAAALLAGTRAGVAAGSHDDAAVVSALLGALALFTHSRVHREPVIAATLVACLLGAEALGVLAFVGIPDLPLPLQVTFAALVYGGLALLCVAAACAALVLRRARVTTVPAAMPQRRLQAAGADRAA